MEGHAAKAIEFLHRQISGCGCIKRGQECDECKSACAALAELEKLPKFALVSQQIEDSILFEGGNG